MRMNLKGINSAVVKLASGEVKTYWYAWRGGPRLKGEPGSPDFVRSYSAAHATRTQARDGTLFALIAEFKASAEFQRLSAPTKRAYFGYLKRIELEFADMPIEALSDPRVRGEFKSWRDRMANTPRAADYAWTVLARVLSVAKDRGRIPVNPCERGGRLYAVDRTDQVWGEAELAKLFAVASKELATAVILALWTGQRQGDLLRLTWSAYDGKHLRLRQSKTGRAVVIPVGFGLKEALNRTPKRSTMILTNSYGVPWTSDGFRTSWGKLRDKAGISGLTFHDLRGSAVVRLALAGASVPEIATFTGHSLADVESILDRHYLGRDVKLAESAVKKLERNERRTKSAKRLQNAPSRTPSDPTK
jgi:integrase